MFFVLDVSVCKFGVIKFINKNICNKSNYKNYIILKIKVKWNLMNGDGCV